MPVAFFPLPPPIILPHYHAADAAEPFRHVIIATMTISIRRHFTPQRIFSFRDAARRLQAAGRRRQFSRQCGRSAFADFLRYTAASLRRFSLQPPAAVAAFQPDVIFRFQVSFFRASFHFRLRY